MSRHKLVVAQTFRIAHLSDLHFGFQFNYGHWEHVEGLLHDTYKPDIVVVTGDLVDSPSFFSLGLARKQLIDLEKKLGCPVMTIPGNHDVGIYGNLAIPPWNTKYRIVFSGTYNSIFDKMPTFLEFSKAPRWTRWSERLTWTFRFALKRLSGSLNDPGREFSTILKPKFGNKAFPIVLAGFDSNSKLWLATGRVDHRAILLLQKGLWEMRTEMIEDHSLCPRIALVHHHLVPIPYSNTKESATAFEPFLVLRNAGTLLDNLLVFDFDLVLHGHKHFSHFAKLSFDANSDDASEIAVISSASSTLDETFAGANSFNVIDILPNGLISYEPVFFGAGKTSKSAQAVAQSTRKHLFSIEACKMRAHRKAVDRLNCDVELTERSLKIDEQGNSEFTLSIKGYRVLHGESICKPQFVLSVLRGAIVPNSIRLNKDSELQGYQLEIDRRSPPTNHVVIPIDLGHGASDVENEKGVSYGIELKTVNTYIITNWEAKEVESPEYLDFFGTIIRQPLQAITLILSLPKEFKDPNPHVWVERLEGYPLLKFDDKHKEICIPQNPMEKGELVYDFEMTQHESGNLKMVDTDGQSESDKNMWVLHVRNPMLGFCYKIRWAIKTDNEDIDPIVLSNTIQIRKNLLDLSLETLPSILQERKTEAQEMFAMIFENLLYPIFRSTHCYDEKIEASILVYDNFDTSQKIKVLRLLFETGTGIYLPGRCEVIPFNEGVAGAAFKSRTIRMYVLPQLVGKEYESAYVYYGDKERPPPGEEYTALISIPLYLGEYPGNHIISPKEVIGVFNLGTNAYDSGLLKLIKPKLETDQSSADFGMDLGGALWFLALRYIDGLANILTIGSDDKKIKKSEQIAEYSSKDCSEDCRYVILKERENGLFAPEKNECNPNPMTLTQCQRERARTTISNWINKIENKELAKKIGMFLNVF